DIAVGPSGQVVVTYQDLSTLASSGQGPSAIYVNTNPTGLGGTFGPRVTVATTNIGGGHVLPGNRNNFRSRNQTSLAYDNSSGPFRGRLYLAFTEALNAFSAVTSIKVCTSVDNGATWSAPVTVNDVGTNSRFLPTIAVDPITGTLAASWYDSRNA